MIHKIATKQEIDIHWSLDDLADAHEILDAQEEYEQEQSEKMNSKR